MKCQMFSCAGLLPSDAYLVKAKQERLRKKGRDKKRKKKKHRKGGPSESEEDEESSLHLVSTAVDLPEGAALSDNEEDDRRGTNDPHSQLDINLDE